MALIKKRSEARELARATIMDMVLRNAAMLDSVNGNVEVSAAREIFRSKTIKALHAVLEDQLREMELGQYALATTAQVAAPKTRSPEWTEVRDGELGSVITFDGLDLDEQADIEVENFARAVNTPEKDEADVDLASPAWPVGFLSPRVAGRFGLGGLLAFVGYEVFDRRGIDWESDAGLLAGFFVCFLGIFGSLLLPSLVSYIRARRARPRAGGILYVFRLSLSPTKFIVERAGLRVALETEQIERFEGAERLSVLRRDGESLVLPCSLRNGAHESLAAHLNELLREYHGYRG